MTVTSHTTHFRWWQRPLTTLWLCAAAGLAMATASENGFAAAPPPPVQVLLPSPGADFQQVVKRQQVRDQLQQGQLQQQLHRDVSNTSKRPFAGSPQTLRQIDQADQAQRQRDRASQQDLLDRYRDAARLPASGPLNQPVPAPAHSAGH